MRKVYKIISHKHEQDEVLEVKMFSGNNLPYYCEEHGVYLHDLDSDEKDKLIEDMMDEIDKLKVQLEELVSTLTLTNFGIGG